MIHLDANFLIAIIKGEDAHHALASKLLGNGESFASSAVAWMEFTSRPVPDAQKRALAGILTGGIVAFDEAAANLAGELFHLTGSNRRTRLDTMIAANAILSGAALATTNPGDFEPFVPHGLNLVLSDFR